MIRVNVVEKSYSLIKADFFGLQAPDPLNCSLVPGLFRRAGPGQLQRKSAALAPWRAMDSALAHYL